jgi:cystathionine beta-synthase
VSGIGKYLKANAPKVELVLADPVGSVLADYINKGTMGPSTPWLVEGIGEDFIPSIADFRLVRGAGALPLPHPRRRRRSDARAPFE